MFEFDVGVVIPAAGKGDRFPGSNPKQYYKIMGKPLFLYCVEEFYKLPYIKKICLVSDRLEFVENILEENGLKQDKIQVVPGGQTRHISIKNGLTALSKTGSILKVVVIHDGARPIVPEGLLIKVISGAAIHGAAGASRPLTSTVVQPSQDGCLESCLDRAVYLASEMPQAFLLQVILTAYQKCTNEDMEHGTECLDLALRYCGVRAKLVPGPESLWKVTDKKDSYSVQTYLRELATNVCLMGREEAGVMKLLREALLNKVHAVHSLVWGSDTHNTSQTFNTVIVFHDKEIDTDEDEMLRLGTVLDVDKQGLIIHVVEHSNVVGMQTTSIYELHRSGRTMTKQYEKLNKGVVIIHCLSLGEEQKLIDLIVTLVLTDATTFSGQTLFL